MSVEETQRLGVTRWTADTDAFTRVQMNASHQNLEERVAMFLKGTLAARPVASAAYDRALYLDTTGQDLYFCNGTEWLAFAEIAVDVDDTTIERNSNSQLRVKNGGITLLKLDPEVAGAFVNLDGSSAAMTGALLLRDLDPSDKDHAARKAYVDGPYVRCEGTTAQTWPDSDVWKNVAFSSKTVDTGSNYTNTISGSGITNTTKTSYFTVPRTGVYIVSYSTWAPGNSTVLFRFRLRKTGSSEVTFEGPRFRPNAIVGVVTDPAIMTGTHAIRAVQGDQIALQCAPATAGTYSVGQDLTITWLHGAPNPYLD